MITKKTLGDRLRDCRQDLDMTQADLADRLNKPRETIARWECGTRIPSIHELTSISQVFKTSTDFLIFGVSHENKTVSSDLGLFEDTINRLKLLVKNNSDSAICVANLLISDDTFLEYVGHMFYSSLEVSLLNLMDIKQQLSQNQSIDNARRLERARDSDYLRYQCVKSFEALINHEIERQILTFQKVLSRKDKDDGNGKA